MEKLPMRFWPLPSMEKSALASMTVPSVAAAVRRGGARSGSGVISALIDELEEQPSARAHKKHLMNA
jgi:hypothetical protein